MARQKTKRVPITQTTAVRPAAAVRTTATTQAPAIARREGQKRSQTLINAFHALLKRQAQLRAAAPDDAEAHAAVAEQIAALGGLDAYQHASLKGGAERFGRGRVGKWAAPHLRGTHGDGDERDSDADSVVAAHPYRLLDVGALSHTTYASLPWIGVTGIDLNPQCPEVVRQDFFERPIPTRDAERFHAVSLSLVVNFVPDVRRRGLMLWRVRRFLLDDGLLYVVLPLPCLMNSRYTTPDSWVALMDRLGFAVVQQYHSKRLAFYLFRMQPRPRFAPMPVWTTPVLRDQPGHNNFKIACPVTKDASKEASAR
ncbi:hypothetical protein CXG81DRAFT_15656 [Caulochytrium protostelioides]|uniref:25S rRNA adenine-N(1) methyltransferase n=1 Tax=Caulochytrium protostelioides TaxID=1555241 RepID=A0A4P9X2E5_9FUNG|nr:hypothetical protein CXG81DRAFT_15656 [Caulochytrium protostelioides]|eukprot:RKO98630.1 hypothetical protein CXG81DRAFT_15656 [Caulochytrium protostelioides]